VSGFFCNPIVSPTLIGAPGIPRHKHSCTRGLPEIRDSGMSDSKWSGLSTNQNENNKENGQRNYPIK